MKGIHNAVFFVFFLKNKYFLSVNAVNCIQLGCSRLCGFRGCFPTVLGGEKSTHTYEVEYSLGLNQILFEITSSIFLNMLLRMLPAFSYVRRSASMLRIEERETVQGKYWDNSVKVRVTKIMLLVFTHEAPPGLKL